MKIGIVGHGSGKFTPESEELAKNLIRLIINRDCVDTVISGRSPLGGVDIWAEEIAKEEGVSFIACEPRQKSWYGEYGFKARNIDIAEKSDRLYVVVVDSYPPGYKWKRILDSDGLPYCYHCKGRTGLHVKSGGCWTGWYAKEEESKEVEWVIVPQDISKNMKVVKFDDKGNII